jgi:nucleotide-binding universal stress UspA family protein
MKAQEILVPVDYTNVSHDALRFALDLAHDMHSHVTILHVEPKLYVYTEGYAAPVGLDRQPDEILHELESTIASDLDATVPCELQVAIGDPAQKILDFADSHHSDLIVMGTHGRSGLVRLFRGSVAESVMRQSHCPVFIVKHEPMMESAAAETM